MWVTGPKGNLLSAELEVRMRAETNEHGLGYFTSSYDFSGLVLFEPGAYRFVSRIDGQEIGSATLLVQRQQEV